MELAARDVISRAEATEIAEGRGIDGNVLLDCRHLGPDVILPEAAADPRDGARLPRDRHDQGAGAGPSGHALSDGRRSRPTSTVRPAFRGCTPPAKWRASASTAATAWAQTRCSTRSSSAGVLGSVAAEYVKASPREKAAKISCDPNRSASTSCSARPYTGETHARLRLELATMMDENVGVYRNEAGLEEALAKLQELKKRYKASPSATRAASSIRR